MLIFAVRHGQTDWNFQQRFQGRTDIPLNAAGLAQADEVGAVLARFNPKRVVASPLSRAQATGRTLARAAGLQDVETDERLIERSMGTCEGIYIAERPNYFVLQDADDGSMEPLVAVQERMLAAVRSLAGGGPGPVALVSHGAALNALLTALSGGRYGTGVTRLVNCCVNLIGLDEADGTLALLACNLPPCELPGWARRQNPIVLSADATNAQRLAALCDEAAQPIYGVAEEVR